MPKLSPDFDSSELELNSLLPGRASRCPPFDVLMALDQDVLPADLAGPARAHAAQCSLCELLLTDLASLPEAQLSAGQLERIAASLPLQKTRATFWFNGKGLSGVAAALLLAAGLVFWSHRGKNEEVARIQPPSTLPVFQQKEVPFAPLTAPSGSAVLMTRGSDANSEPASEQLLPAFRAYNHGDYSVAAEQFSRLSAEYPQSGMILLYLSVSQLALHQDAEADATLRRARNTSKPYDTDSTQWYGAVAATRVRSAEAKPLLQALCQNKASTYSARSCDALR